MKHVCLYTLLFFSILISAQNLVPNSSFETFTVCPNIAGGGEIEAAVPWSAATSTSSTDYYNSCSTVMNVPNYNGGFQYAHSGNAYSGLFFYRGSNREYLQVQLTSPLIQDAVYYVEFFVNMSDFYSSPCNNIAANFSLTRPYTNVPDQLQSLIPHIMNSGNPVVNDTSNWVKISNCYIAQGGEEYLTIGNFFDNANTVVTGTTGVSYYFVDDVLVEEITGQCVTGVHEYKKAEIISVYPNPTTGKLKVISQNIKDTEQLQIKITNVFGIEILNESYKEEIDLSLFEKGIYFVSILQGSKSLGVKKIIKE